MAEDLLSEYKKKRDFCVTSEPSGDGISSVSSGSQIFVVQKHDARSLHYDLRLEVNGTLKSWQFQKAHPQTPKINAWQ